ncbi:MAG: universal stress protein [Crocosphaera sp.]|nr:universal stress protein [Crocosphaera sp.]
MVNQVESPQVLNRENGGPQTVAPIYEKILVAIAEDSSSKEVFETALKLAKAQNSQLMIITVIQENNRGGMELPLYPEMTGYAGIYTQEMVELEEKLRQETLEELQSWLKRLNQQAIKQGIKADSDCLYGEPGPRICAMAKQWGAELIIVGRRGRQGLSELLLGSISNYVIHHAPCSSLIVQH